MSNNVFKGSGILMRHIAEVYIILQTVKVGLMAEMLCMCISLPFPARMASNYIVVKLPQLQKWPDQGRQEQTRPRCRVCWISSLPGLNLRWISSPPGLHLLKISSPPGLKPPEFSILRRNCNSDHTCICKLQTTRIYFGLQIFVSKHKTVSKV